MVFVSISYVLLPALVSVRYTVLLLTYFEGLNTIKTRKELATRYNCLSIIYHTEYEVDQCLPLDIP